MSDEEELKRIAQNLAEAGGISGVGEILASVPTEEVLQQELDDLGFSDG